MFVSILWILSVIAIYIIESLKYKHISTIHSRVSLKPIERRAKQKEEEIANFQSHRSAQFSKCTFLQNNRFPKWMKQSSIIQFTINPFIKQLFVDKKIDFNLFLFFFPVFVQFESEWKGVRQNECTIDMTKRTRINQM